jgi:hypothetical protein
MIDMAYWQIYYSCGCGSNEDYIEAADYDAAIHYAYEQALEDYDSYAGLHGIRSEYDYAEELFGEGILWDELTDEQVEEVYEAYHEGRENEVDYWAEEISYREYLIGIGEIDEDDEWEDEEDAD